MMGLLSWAIAIPALTGLLILLVPRSSPAAARQLALLGSILTFLVTLRLWLGFDPGNAGFQFVEHVPWIEEVGSSYHVGVDGLSVLLVLLTVVLTPIAILGSAWSIERRVGPFLAFFMLLEAAMIGVFVALDMVLFYVFWEAMLIPMYFLIGIWGGGRRVYAALKFFLYTMAGS